MQFFKKRTRKQIHGIQLIKMFLDSGITIFSDFCPLTAEGIPKSVTVLEMKVCQKGLH